MNAVEKDDTQVFFCADNRFIALAFCAFKCITHYRYISGGGRACSVFYLQSLSNHSPKLHSLSNEQGREDDATRYSSMYRQKY